MTTHLVSDTPRHPHLRHVPDIQQEDRLVLVKKEHEYNASWKQRGGIGAFMMLARKWDRLEHQLRARYHYDLFEAIENEHEKDGILDDVQDLRRYLILVEAECIERGWLPAPQMARTDWPTLNAASSGPVSTGTPTPSESHIVYAPRSTAERDYIILSVRCPTCHAHTGEPCANVPFQTVHAPRRFAAEMRPMREMIKNDKASIEADLPSSGR